MDLIVRLFLRLGALFEPRPETMLTPVPVPVRVRPAHPPRR